MAAELSPDVVFSQNIKKLEGSDLYKKMNPQQKYQANKFVYTRFGIPAMKSAGIEPNVDHFKTWMQGRAKGQTDISIATSTTKKLAGSFASGVIDTADAVTKLVEGPADVKAKDDAARGGKPSWVRSHLDELKSARDMWMEDHYSHTLKDETIKGGGILASQLPAFILSDGVAGDLKLGEVLEAEINPNAPKLAKAVGRMVNNAVSGYLAGGATGDNAAKSAEGFAIGGELFKPVETFLGKLVGIGGNKLVKETVESTAKAISEDAPETTAHPSMVKMGGSAKQRIHAATLQALHDLTGGNFIKASPSLQAKALEKLQKVAPELGDELGFINQNIVEGKAILETMKWRAAVPEANELLTKLEKLDGVPTPKAVAQATAEKVKNKRVIKQAQRSPSTVVPGAASSSSYEFEDNVSKAVEEGLKKMGLGKSKYEFEDRGHKLLFALNLMLTKAKEFGPSKESNKLFDAVTKKLGERYPEHTFRDFMTMSDNMWTHIENLGKAGLDKEGEKVRIFRNTELRPGQSPFGHQMQLLQEAAAKDKLPIRTQETK